MDPLEHEFRELTFAALLRSSLTVSHTWQKMANWGLFLESWRKSGSVRMPVGSAVWLLPKSVPCSRRHSCCLPQPDPGWAARKSRAGLSSPKIRLSLLESDPLKDKPSLNSSIRIFAANDSCCFRMIIFISVQKSTGVCQILTMFSCSFSVKSQMCFSRCFFF